MGGHPGPAPCSIKTSGKERVLHSFGSGGDGTLPWSDLFYQDDALYGTTYRGGANDRGTAFKFALSGAKSVVYSFKGSSADGFSPRAGVIFYKHAFYGTCGSGGIGSSGSGTVFKLTPSGQETVLHISRVIPTVPTLMPTSWEWR